MKIIGLIGSARKKGNTEILVKEVLKAAREKGAEVESIRLTDYEIQPCTGCMACVLKKEGCPISDGVNAIFEKMIESDGIVVGTPIYFLGANGIIKVLIDRGFQHSFPDKMPLKGKLGVTCAVAGVPNWEQFGLLELYLLFSSLGISLIDQIMAYAQGPGELILKSDSLERAHKAGRALVEALKSNNSTYQGEPGLCPVCHNNLLTISKDGKYFECPMCLVKGKPSMDEKGNLTIKFLETERHRWEEKARREHVNKNIIPSFQRYRENIREIRQKIKEAYLDEL
jgi:multimeric flavodoxin WrbA